MHRKTQRRHNAREKNPRMEMQDNAEETANKGSESVSTTFAELGLKPETLAGLKRAGYTKPTPIQAGVIPLALAGHDVIGQAQTGTGKTASFLLPFLNAWSRGEASKYAQALILLPTRELAAQVVEEARKILPDGGPESVVVCGGQSMGPQVRALEKKVPLIVGTPGRVIDHLMRGTFVPVGPQYVVLDEADRMLDIGFRPDIEKILRRCPQDRQTLLLSATLPEDVLRLTQRYQRDPKQVRIASEQPTVKKIRQSYVAVEEDRKLPLLLRILKDEKPTQSIIFVERKRWAENLYSSLRRDIQGVSMIHGDLPQGMRDRVMEAFRQGRIKHLVATDVVGRGIDVKDISHVVNYDIPEDPEAYVHRIGRTGRIGANGIAIAFVSPDQGERLTKVEMFINQMLEKREVEGFESVRPKDPAPEKPPEAPKTSQPVFGRRVKKYSNRL
jgi:ATP-dependent RNA helicase DeaD